MLSWSWVLGMLVASASSDSTWASICSTSSLMLTVSSSSMGTEGLCTAATVLGKGIWPGSLRGESSRTPKTCRAVNHPPRILFCALKSQPAQQNSRCQRIPHYTIFLYKPPKPPSGRQVPWFGPCLGSSPQPA